MQVQEGFGIASTSLSIQTPRSEIRAKTQPRDRTSPIHQMVCHSLDVAHTKTQIVHSRSQSVVCIHATEHHLVPSSLNQMHARKVSDRVR